MATEETLQMSQSPEFDAVDVQVASDEMRVELVTIPKDLRHLVERYGKPMIVLDEGMTTLIWSCAGVGSEPDADGGIVVRADGEDAFAECARQVDEITRSLSRAGRRPWFIVATRCAADDRGRSDLARVQDLVIADKLRWIAIWDKESLSTTIEAAEIFSYGDEREDYHWLDDNEVGDVLTRHGLS
jgi:hypothetical protein